MYKTKMEKSLVLLCVLIVGLQVTQPHTWDSPELKQAHRLAHTIDE